MRRLRLPGAAAGAAAPVLFALVVSGLTVHQRSFLADAGWDPVRRTPAGWPSILAFGADGWLMVAAFAVCGGLGVLFALALRARVPAGAAKAGAVLLGLLALAVALEALKADPPWLTGRSWHGRVHDLVYPAIPVCAVAAAICLAVGLRRQPGWRFSLLAALVMGAALVVQTQEQVGQLGEYLFFGPLLLWLELLALGLRARG